MEGRKPGPAKGSGQPGAIVAAPLAAASIPAARVTAPPLAAQSPPTVAAPQDAPAQAMPTSFPLHDFVGKTLVAVDGSTIDLGQGEGGLTRQVTLPPASRRRPPLHS